MYRTRRGFISTRTIIALLITITILPIAVYVIGYASNLSFNYEIINDEISLFQLRRILLIAYDVNNNGDCLNFIYHNDNYSLSLVNNRLVLEPGYQMFLDNVDQIEFYEVNNAIYLKYVKGSDEYETPIIKQKGIYLDDFSDIDDELNEPFDSNEWIHHYCK